MTLLTFLVLASTGAICGQGIGSSYPRSPTLSPYLDLLRNDGGVLPNYQQFVRPKIQLRAQIERQNYEIQRQRRAIRSLDRRVSTPQAPGNLTTGVRASFLRYSTFYPSLNP
ncbi:hypothetical protein [Crateriforma conspicua]|uniref:hypothetical protein n=1 Tax=Crateriforma conspicua TaxID=2527996 RepID=UPI0011A31CB2|nr:hypothetical protein [Crateriforma conspicua]